MQAAIVSQCKLIKRVVTCILFSSLKMYIVAAFCCNCTGLIELAARPAKRALDRTVQNSKKCILDKLRCEQLSSDHQVDRT